MLKVAHLPQIPLLLEKGTSAPPLIANFKAFKKAQLSVNSKKLLKEKPVLKYDLKMYPLNSRTIRNINTHNH